MMKSVLPAARAVLAEIGIPEVCVVAAANEVAEAEASPECAVPFAEALKRAILAFARNREGSGGDAGDSPASLVAATPDMFDLPTGVDNAVIADTLLNLLRKDSAAEIILLTPSTLEISEYRFLPEYGESIEENWVFRIRLPNTLPLLIWAIVDRTGKRDDYCYTFD